MRCCAGNDGIKKCMRINSGDICGLTFEGRGACCCPGTCKSNECITTAPSTAPTGSTSAPSAAPTDDNHDDNDGNGSDDDNEIFNAQQISAAGLTDNKNSNQSENVGYMWSLSDKANNGFMGLLVFVGFSYPINNFRIIVSLI
eukprot:TRINITY_DN9621_c0_g1_i1.p1 TRINITY_DN9621_c0_g1~~TRINITY_DN9621_c0_g1_i1.p1  ORF type:complete len:143 (-),score=16.07 TRINITY_DN9621_c0_g1_i1:222-650(-)